MSREVALFIANLYKRTTLQLHVACLLPPRIDEKHPIAVFQLLHLKSFKLVLY